MRKILLFFWVFACLSVHAQSRTVDRRKSVENSQSVLANSKKQSFEIKPGYEQSIEIAYNCNFIHLDMGMNVNYIGGWRFNRMFYAGVGTGLYLNFMGNKNSYCFDYQYRYPHIDYLNTPLLSVPLYAHGRVYFTRNRCMPFIGLSVGGMFSATNSLYVEGYRGYYEVEYYEYYFPYETSRFLMDFMVGIDYRINAKADFYFSVSVNGITNKSFYHTKPESGMMEQYFDVGINAHIGFTF